MYPEQVPIDQKRIEKLLGVLQGSFNETLVIIQRGGRFNSVRKREIIARITQLLQETAEQLTIITGEDIDKMYKMGIDDAVRQLKNINVPVEFSTFTVIHKEAVRAIIDETAELFGTTMTRAKDDVTKAIAVSTRESITDQLARNLTQGQALENAKKRVISVLKEQGLTAMVDKGGNTWTAERYSEMLYRTKMVEARNRGVVNRMVENNYDLVQVSKHPNPSDLCQPFEGKILSLTGKTKGYITIDLARSEGLFHPNCKHSINVLIPSLAKKTQAYNPETGLYQ